MDKSNPFFDHYDYHNVKPALKEYTAIQPEIIQAAPMVRIDFALYTRTAMPIDADPEEKGYMVKRQKYGQMKHPNHEGFISWMSKSDFEQQYQEF